MDQQKEIDPIKLRPANDKLREAEFFFMLMEKYFDHYEFKYLLSAFLSALYSCTEHNRLYSADPRFKDWFREINQTHISHPDLQNLREVRRHEIHHKGRETLKRVGFSFPEGIETTQVELVFDFRGGEPIGQYKTAEMEEFKEYPLEQRWVWMTEGEPDVMDLCSKGLVVVREIIKSRDSMGFPD
jgi:hypothetical protein